MILGSKASTYAILSVIEIARHQGANNDEGTIRASEIAEHFELPAAYAAKVMTQLVRADILRSDRGPRGGFRLTRSPKDISVLEILEAVDGQIEVDAVMRGTATTRETLSCVHGIFEQAVRDVREILGTRPIAECAPSVNAVDEPELPRLTH
ncbi:MAG: Rrf2 family transcriptional regulator [Phycisphaerae bacterium]|nr:Rrf2 family transcriptional regulator [Phycisphaerae bacterium]